MPTQEPLLDLAAPQHTSSTMLVIDVVESVRLMEANEQDAVHRWRPSMQAAWLKAWVTA
jgi:DNA polymerase IIIc chi subunit